MATASPNPQNLLMLAGLGIGAYWFMTRRAVAQQVPTQAQIPNIGPAAYRAETASLAGGLVGLAGRLFGGQNLHGTADGRSQSQWDVTPAGADGPRFNNPSAYASSAIDGVAWNPTAAAPYDFSEWGMPSGPSGAWT